MRYALPGSALVHAGIFGIAFVGFAWPPPEDAPPPGAVTVDIVSVISVSSNLISTLEQGSAESLVSAGSETVSPEPSETLEPVEPETQMAEVPVEEALPPDEAAPVETAAAAPVEAEPIEPGTETMEVAVLATPVNTPEPIDTIAPMVAETVEPAEVTDFNAAPVPHVLSFERPSAPTQRPRPPATQQATRPAPQKPPQQGNSGQSNADSAAARAAQGQQGGQGSGGAAQMASWQQQVSRRLNSARRYPRSAGGATGTAVVGFTVTANGGLGGVSLLRSSGNPALDQAALDAVSRAAPFPPPPSGVNTPLGVPVDFTR